MSAPEQIAGHPVHKFAQKLPLMPEDELARLVASMKTLGFSDKEPIVLLDGEILDGRNRGLAAELAEVAPKFREATAEERERPLAWVCAWNLDRRHLNASQRALLAAELLPELEKEARARQLAALQRGKVPPAVEFAGPAGEYPPKRDRALEICLCGDLLGQHSKRGCSKCTCEMFEPAAQGAPLPPQGGNGEDKAAAREAKKAAGTAAAAAAATVGASERNVQRAKFVLQEAPAAVVKRVRDGKATLKQAESEIRKADQLKKIRVYRPPTGEFAVISVDYPWPYSQKLDGSDAMRGGCPYPTLPIRKGMKLKIPAAKACVLFLWIPNAHLVNGNHLPLLKAWGFRVLPPEVASAKSALKTLLTWVKNRFGNGWYLRGQTEHVVVAIKGKPLFTLTNQSTYLPAAVGAHSEKPVEFYKLVESLCPAQPRLEMFARAPREGWVTTGAELAQKVTKKGRGTGGDAPKARKKLPVWRWFLREAAKASSRAHAFGGPLNRPSSACGRERRKRAGLPLRSMNGVAVCQGCVRVVVSDVGRGTATDDMERLWQRDADAVATGKETGQVRSARTEGKSKRRGKKR